MTDHLKIAVLLISLVSVSVDKSGATFLCNLADPTDCSCVKIETHPVNTYGVFGSTISLQCRVDGVEGQEIQWTQDGVALGVDPQIPGYPRYTMTDNSGNTLSGDYDLIVTDVQLEDEAVYECQVTDCDIQSNEASLVVLVPPEGPYVIDEEPNGEYNVIVDNAIDITCEAWNAKPVSDVSWFIGNDQIPEGEMVTKTVYPSDTPLQNSSATLHLRPSLVDDEVVYTCIMNNDALIAENPAVIAAQKNDISLIVLVPPEGPIIENLNPSEGTITVAENEPYTLTCRTVNGKPEPTVTWYRDSREVTNNVDMEIGQPDMYGRQNVSAYLRLIGNVTDDNIRFACTVLNDAITFPQSMSFILQVSTPISPVVLGVAIAGVVLFLLILLLVIILLCKRRKKRKNEENQVEEAIEPVAMEAEQQPPTNNTPEATSTSSATTTNSIKKEVDFDLDSTVSIISLQAAINEAYESEEESSSESEDDEEDSTSSSSSSSISSANEEATSDDTSIHLPDGDIFSVSSSLWRSQRGSPVPGQELEITTIPTVSNTSWMNSLTSTPQYVVRNPSIGMVTDV